MAQARTPARVMYACGLVIVGSILFLMIYSGMLEGVGEAIFGNAAHHSVGGVHLGDGRRGDLHADRGIRDSGDFV